MSSSSQAKITLRPPPHVDFIQGYPGIPSLAPSPASRVARPAAHIAGTVEVRLGTKGLRAAWLRIELRKLETVAGENWGELIGRGPIDVWTSRGASEGTTDPDDESAWDILQTADFPFRISIPEGLPPSARIDKACSISYELVTSLCIRAKKGLLKKEATSSVIQSTHPITIDKHELHCTWPIYNIADTHESTTDNIRAKVFRSSSCYSPGDPVDVRVIVSSNRVNPAKLKSVSFVIRETVTFRGAAAGNKRATLTSGGGGKAASQKTEILVQRSKTVGKKIYKGDSQMFDLQVVIPKTHTLMTIQTAKHVEVSYTMRVLVDIKDANIIVDHLPMTMSSFSRPVSADLVKRIGYVAGLSDFDDSVSTSYLADDDSYVASSDPSMPPLGGPPRQGQYPQRQDSYAMPRQDSYGVSGRQDSYPAPPNLSRSQSYNSQSRFSSPQRNDTMYSVATRSSVSGPGLAGRGAIGVNGASGLPSGQPGQVFSWGAYGAAQPFGPDGANGVPRAPVPVRSAFAGPGTFHESDNLAPEENRALYHSPLPSDVAGIDSSENRFHGSPAQHPQTAVLAGEAQAGMRASPPPMMMQGVKRVESPGPAGQQGTYPQSYRASIAAYPERTTASPRPQQAPARHSQYDQQQQQAYQNQQPLQNPHVQMLKNSPTSNSLPNGRPSSVPAFASPMQQPFNAAATQPQATPPHTQTSTRPNTPADATAAAVAAAAAAAAAASAEAEKTRLYERARQQAERNQRRADERRAKLAAANGGTVDSTISTTMRRSISAGTEQGTLTPDGYGGMKPRSPEASFAANETGSNMSRTPTLPSSPSAEAEKMRLYEHARKQAERYQAGYKMGASFPKDIPGSPLGAGPSLASGSAPAARDGSAEPEWQESVGRAPPQRRESAAFWMTEAGPQRAGSAGATTVATQPGQHTPNARPPASSQQVHDRPSAVPGASSSGSNGPPRFMQSFPSAEDEKRRLYEAAKRETEAHLQAESSGSAQLGPGLTQVSSGSSAAHSSASASASASGSAPVGSNRAAPSISAADEKEQMRRFYEAKEQVERKAAEVGGSAAGQSSSGAGPARKPTYGPGSEPYDTAPLPTYDAVVTTGAGSSPMVAPRPSGNTILLPAASASASGSGPSGLPSLPASVSHPGLSEKEQLRLYYAARDAQAAPEGEAAAEASRRISQMSINGTSGSAQGVAATAQTNGGAPAPLGSSDRPGSMFGGPSSSSSGAPASSITLFSSSPGPAIPDRPQHPRRTGSVMGARPLPGSTNQTPRTSVLYSSSINESSGQEQAGPRSPAPPTPVAPLTSASLTASQQQPSTVPPPQQPQQHLPSPAQSNDTAPLVGPPPASDIRMPGSSADAWASTQAEKQRDGLLQPSVSSPFILPPLDFSAATMSPPQGGTTKPPPALPPSLAGQSSPAASSAATSESLSTLLGHLAKSGSEYGPRMAKNWWEEEDEEDSVMKGAGEGTGVAPPKPPPLPPKTIATQFQ